MVYSVVGFLDKYYCFVFVCPLRYSYLRCLIQQATCILHLFCLFYLCSLFSIHSFHQNHFHPIAYPQKDWKSVFRWQARGCKVMKFQIQIVCFPFCFPKWKQILIQCLCFLPSKLQMFVKEWLGSLTAYKHKSCIYQTSWVHLLLSISCFHRKPIPHALAVQTQQ